MPLRTRLPAASGETRVDGSRSGCANAPSNGAGTCAAHRHRCWMRHALPPSKNAPECDRGACGSERGACAPRGKHGKPRPKTAVDHVHPFAPHTPHNTPRRGLLGLRALARTRRRKTTRNAIAVGCVMRSLEASRGWSRGSTAHSGSPGLPHRWKHGSGSTGDREMGSGNVPLLHERERQRPAAWVARSACTRSTLNRFEHAAAAWCTGTCTTYVNSGPHGLASQPLHPTGLVTARPCQLAQTQVGAYKDVAC